MTTSTEVVDTLRRNAKWGDCPSTIVLGEAVELIEDLESMLLEVRNEAWPYLFVEQQKRLDTLIEKWKLET